MNDIAVSRFELEPIFGSKIISFASPLVSLCDSLQASATCLDVVDLVRQSSRFSADEIHTLLDSTIKLWARDPDGVAYQEFGTFYQSFEVGAIRRYAFRRMVCTQIV